jgi:hypothetical protein
VTKSTSVDAPTKALQILAVELGGRLAEANRTNRDDCGSINRIMDVITTKSWPSSDDAVVSGGAHILYEISKQLCGGGEKSTPCSRYCSEESGRFCDLLASDLARDDQQSARDRLDYFADKTRGSASARFDAILHYATYVCLGYETRATELGSKNLK